MPEESLKNLDKSKVKDKKITFEVPEGPLNVPTMPVENESVSETVEDPFCDEKNPRIISFQDVCQAAFMIKGGIDVTPCRVNIFA